MNQNQYRFRVRFFYDLFHVTYWVSLIKDLCAAVEYIYVDRVNYIL